MGRDRQWNGGGERERYIEGEKGERERAKCREREWQVCTVRGRGGSEGPRDGGKGSKKYIKVKYLWHSCLIFHPFVCFHFCSPS